MVFNRCEQKVKFARKKSLELILIIRGIYKTKKKKNITKKKQLLCAKTQGNLKAISIENHMKCQLN